jgi:cell wall-associated NlpC family hydrolase
MAISKQIKISISAAAAAVLILCSPVSAEAKKVGVVTGNVVNFRQNPNTSSKILDQLTEGSKVNIVDSEGDWYKAVHNDITGWISGEWLKVQDEKIATGVVSGSVVNVRSKADISSEVLTKFEKGTKVDIYDHTGDWYRVSIGEGRYGWMNSDYVTVKDGSASKTTAAAKDDKSEAGEIPDVSGEETEPEKADEGDGKNKDLTDRGGTEADRKEALLRQQIVDFAKTLIGIPYVYGGESTKGFDCSGFVKYVYNHFDLSIARSSSEQAKGGKAVKKADLQPGDLVFFDTNGGLNNITHVGIYIGDGKFIHASTYSKHAITIESMSSAYYSKRYMKSRDYISK